MQQMRTKIGTVNLKRVNLEEKILKVHLKNGLLLVSSSTANSFNAVENIKRISSFLNAIPLNSPNRLGQIKI